MTKNSLFNIPDSEFKKIKKISNLIKIPKSNILITGGTGFIGRWITEAINNIKNVNKIYLISRNKKKFFKKNKYVLNSKKIIVLEIDLSKNNKNLILNKNIKYIFHLACSTNLNKNTNSNYYRNLNYYSTKNIIKIAKANNTKKIFFSSSGAAYLNNFNDKNYYGIGKLISENLLISDSVISNKTIIARMYNYFGPLQPIESNYAICNFFHNIIHNKDIVIKGNGKNYRNFMYVLDLIKIILKITFVKKNSHLFTDLASKNNISLKDLAIKMKKITESKAKIKVLNKINSFDYAPIYKNKIIMKESNFDRCILTTYKYYKNN